MSVPVAETAEDVTAPCEVTEDAPQPPVWQGADTADLLSYAALVRGVPEAALVEELLCQSGDDGARWESHLHTRRRQSEAQQVERLAAEFAVLSAQVPEVQHMEDVPDTVFQTALEQHITLCDAYLRQWYAAQQQVQAQQQAVAQSVGALGGAFEQPDPRETAFSRAFRTALA